MVQLVSTNVHDPVVAKVGDFGLSSTLVISGLKEKAHRRAVMNPTWLAPEITKVRPAAPNLFFFLLLRNVVLWANRNLL